MNEAQSFWALDDDFSVINYILLWSTIIYWKCSFHHHEKCQSEKDRFCLSKAIQLENYKSQILVGCSQELKPRSQVSGWNQKQSFTL